jgi:hypothetical protein
MATLFGKPKDEVIKHPGSFSAKAKAAGKSTKEFAKEHEHSKGLLGKQARLAETLMGMSHKRRKYYGEK